MDKSDVTFRRLDRSWVRDQSGWTSGGHPVAVHVTTLDDMTPVHITYPRGYDSRCGWCYLGANHSEASHAVKVAEATEPVEQIMTVMGMDRTGDVVAVYDGGRYVDHRETWVQTTTTEA